MNVSNPLESEMNSVRENKHIALHEAVLHLDSVIFHLDGLVERMANKPVSESGDEVQSKNSAPPAPPSLVDVLNNASSEIQQKVERMHARISMIEKMLF